MEDTIGKAADIADTQYGAGHRHGQHGGKLDEALGLEVLFDHQVADDHGEQRGNGRRNERQDKGIGEGLQAVIAGEYTLEPFEGEMEIVAPGIEESAEGHADIHEDDENGDGAAQHGKRYPNALIGDEHAGPAGLAGEGGCCFALKVVLLYQEHDEGNGQEHHGHGRRADLIVGTGDLQVDGGGQGIVAAADDHGVGEIGDGFNEGHEKGIAEAGQHERQGNTGEYLPAGGAHITGGLLQAGVDIFEQAAEHKVADREEGHGLYDDDAPEAIDAVIVNMQQVTGDDARLTEQHNDGQGQNKGGRDDRQHGNYLEQAAHEFTADLDIHFDIGEQQADKGRADAYHKADLEGIANGGAEGPHIKDTLENREGEASPIGRDKAIHQQDGQRVNDKQSEERDQYDDGSDHDGIGKELFAIQRGALSFCHVASSFR